MQSSPQSSPQGHVISFGSKTGHRAREKVNVLPQLHARTGLNAGAEGKACGPSKARAATGMTAMTHMALRSQDLNPNAHQQIEGHPKCGTSRRWSIIQPFKKKKFLTCAIT